jgi:septum formation protein
MAADTVVDLDGETMGKPRDLPDARRMLRALSGRDHAVLTAVCIEHGATGRREAFVEESRVRFAPLDETGIEAYLSAVHVLDKAGAYAIQERADLLGARVEGSFSNVIGLPMERVASALREMTGPA